MNIRFVTIGSDPEFFIVDSNGKPVSVAPFSAGTKDEPVPLPQLGDGFFEQRDNLSFEGNIPPARDKNEFITNIILLRNYFLSKIASHGLRLSDRGVLYFDEEDLCSPEGMEFGCSSVYSAWESCLNNAVEQPTPSLKDKPYRVAGFHIHIGYRCSEFMYDIFGNNKINIDILIARLFDMVVTLPSHRICDEPERLQSYGAFGKFRSKSYGVECRTLSAFFSQPEHLEWVWDHVMEIERIINEADMRVLYELVLRRHSLPKNVNKAKEYLTETIFKPVFNLNR